jgi:hypothetical protein
MHSPFRRAMATVVAVFATLVVLAGTSAAQAAPSTPAPEKPRKTIMFVGDSMTANYSDIVGDSQRGWWSMVAADLNHRPIVAAVRHSGYLRYGMKNCSGSRFGSRLDAIVAAKPDVLVIAGGRNDLEKCSNGKAVKASPAEASSAIKTYYAALAKRLNAAGLKRSEVFVLTPWGTARADRAADIRSSVRYWATKNGFIWVPTRSLRASELVDGTHQNEDGNFSLYQQLMANKDFSRLW